MELQTEMLTAQDRYRASPKYRATLGIRNARPRVKAANRAAQVRYRERYPEQRRESERKAAAKRYAENPEAVRAIQTKSAVKRAHRILYNSAVQRARKYKIEFDLSLGDLLPLPTHCPIFGVKLEYGGGKGREYNPNAASLDRFDPTKGYVKGNIIVMSRRANSIKNDGTALEHRAIADWMDRMVGGDNGD